MNLMCNSPKHQSKQQNRGLEGVWNYGQPNLARWPLQTEKATGCPLNVAAIQASAIQNCHSARPSQTVST